MRTKRARTVIIVAIVVLAIAIPVASHKWGPYHFQAVRENVLYRSGSMRLYNLMAMARWHDIRTIVSLRAPGEGGYLPNWYQTESDFCRRHRIKFVNIPIRGKERPTDDQVRHWLDIMSDPSNYPVLVHCAQGVVRTGVMVALYRIACEQVPNAQAWDELPTFGHDFQHPGILKLRQFVLDFSPAALGRARENLTS